MEEVWRKPRFKRLNRILELMTQLRELEIEEAKKKIKRLEFVLAAKKSRATNTARGASDS